MSWGADDYFILPLEPRDFARIAGEHKNTARTATVNTPDALSDRGVTSQTHQANDAAPVLAIPLAAQSHLLEELCKGLVEKNDFADHAVDTVAHHLGLDGRLRFLAGPDVPSVAPHDARKSAGLWPRATSRPLASW